MPKQLPLIDWAKKKKKFLNIQTIPINYLQSIRVEFKEGKIWEIDCNAKRSTGANLDDTIAELFDEYGKSIKQWTLG